MRDLNISPQQELDPATLKRVAGFLNADTIVFGKYVKVGEQIQITSTVDDLKRDHQFDIVTTVASDKELPTSIATLAQSVREKMAASAGVKELASRGSFILTKSAPALRAYNEGLQLARANKYGEAAQSFEQATADDPNFALAYSELANAYKAQGFDDKAEISSRQAVTLSENLPDNEKFLVQANNAVITNDTPKAIAAYEKLTSANPDDMEAQFELAKLYEKVPNYDAARQHLAKVRAADKNNPDVLLVSGRVEIKAGTPQASLDYLSSAYNLATQSNNEVLKAAILQVEGVAYHKLNQPKEALKNLQEALAISRSLNLPSAVATSLNEIAQIQDGLGDSTAALAGFKESLDIRKKIGDKNGIALSLLELGTYYSNHAKYDEALKMLNEALTQYRDLGDQVSQALCLNNIGTAQCCAGELPGCPDLLPAVL